MKVLPNGMEIASSIKDESFDYDVYSYELSFILTYNNDSVGVGDSSGCWVVDGYWDNVFSTE